jgi:hypothetical protein
VTANQDLSFTYKGTRKQEQYAQLTVYTERWTAKTYPVEQHDIIIVRKASKIKCPLSSNELQKHDSIPKNICLLRRLSGGEVLWGNVSDRPSNSCCYVGVLVIHKSGKAKVTDNRFKVFVQKNVGSFHITMNDLGITMVMQVRESPGRSQCNPSPCVPIKRWILWLAFYKI